MRQVEHCNVGAVGKEVGEALREPTRKILIEEQFQNATRRPTRAA
jgi:hypothetical protein